MFQIVKDLVDDRRILRVSVPLRGKMFQILSREGGVGFGVLGVFAARMGKCGLARPMSVKNARKGLC